MWKKQITEVGNLLQEKSLQCRKMKKLGQCLQSCCVEQWAVTQLWPTETWLQGQAGPETQESLQSLCN